MMRLLVVAGLIGALAIPAAAQGAVLEGGAGRDVLVRRRYVELREQQD